MNPLKYWLDDARRAPSTRYVDVCDGLRAFAVMIIGWFHIWQQSWLFPGLNLFGHEISLDPLVRSGYIWVDMMILLSGFCHFLPWARVALEDGVRPNTLDFYAKRLIRIHPSYLLCLAIMLGVAIARGSYWTQDEMILDVASHLTYTHTFFYNSYYATKLGGSLWTLAIEMQFYLIAPMLCRAFVKRPVITFAGMVSLSLAFRAWVAANVQDYSLYFNQLPAYLDVFACGMAVAMLYAFIAKKRHGALGRILCSVGVVFVCALLWDVVKDQAGSSGTQGIQLGQMNRRILMGVLGSALILLSANAGLLVRKLLSNPLTKFISAISFQFYIWHQTLAVWILQARLIPSEYENPNYAGDHPWQLAFTAACFLGAIAVSALLTYGFERPIARFLQKKWDAFRRKRRAKAT